MSMLIGKRLRTAAIFPLVAILPASITAENGSAGQPPAVPQGPRFEVVSIKLNADTGVAGPTAIPGSRPGDYFRSASSVRALIQQAWQMPFIR